MCGIIGYVGPQQALPILISGLYRLEYRGYDSAGVAIATRSGLRVQKAEGRIPNLESCLPKRMRGGLGIGHTRWATHGEPSDLNAHPHTDSSGQLALVHNGIIENAAALRDEFVGQGVEFRSETDSEVLAELIAAHWDGDLEAAVRAALLAVEGTYGIAVIDQRQPGQIIVARNGSPVIVGLGEREMFVASDVAALVRHTKQVVHLDDGELAVVEASGFRTSTLDARPTEKSTLTVSWGQEAYDRGEHEHFFHKEIFEQPEACERTLRGRLDLSFSTAHLGGLNLTARELLEIRRIVLLGAGSAYYAASAGAQMLETLTRVPAHAEPAAEFRYRDPVIEKDALYLAVSQSGETFDTLAAVQEIRRKGGRVLGVVNSVGSTIARECDGGIYIHAGVEVSVTSTKTYTSTLVALALLALHIGRIRDLSPSRGRDLIDALRALPSQIEQILAGEDEIRALARGFAQHTNAFFIGRAAAYVTAREGAQKLKEISYIHAEAYPASELKHGPLALVGPDTPTLAVAPHGPLLGKMLSSMEEIRARRGRIIALTHPDEPLVESLSDAQIVVPRSEPALDPILMGIPLQLLAYHCARELGRDIDKPRNLAKSVTVE